ncbi:MAG: hypothetical protein AABZ47_11815, partial [Planctomycetota bacterium]
SSAKSAARLQKLWVNIRQEPTVVVQCSHDYAVNLKVQGYGFLTLTAQWNSSADDPAFVDGFPPFSAPMLVTPDTAGDVLVALTEKSNSGVSVGSRSDLVGNP